MKIVSGWPGFKLPTSEMHYCWTYLLGLKGLIINDFEGSLLDPETHSESSVVHYVRFEVLTEAVMKSTLFGK
jgi:hypothetical protein